jgi:hypothetical protein
MQPISVANGDSRILEGMIMGQLKGDSDVMLKVTSGLNVQACKCISWLNW